MNFQQKITVFATDIVVLIEVAVAVYLANAEGAAFTPVFFKSLGMMMLPTVALAFLLVRKFRGEGEGSEA